MPHTNTAYQLGCKYAASTFEKEARGVVADYVARMGANKGLWQRLVGSPGAQYAASGLGGGLLGAGMADEGNRGRGFAMGAAGGLAARGLGGMAARRGAQSFQNAMKASPELTQQLGPDALRQGTRISQAVPGALGAAAGLAGGAGVVGGLMPHEEQPWYSKLRSALPF